MKRPLQLPMAQYIPKFHAIIMACDLKIMLLNYSVFQYEDYKTVTMSIWTYDGNISSQYNQERTVI